MSKPECSAIVLDLLKDSGAMTTKEICTKIGKSRGTVTHALHKLRMQGAIVLGGAKDEGRNNQNSSVKWKVKP
jgi:DNA-binding transcriptional ArsR family regulator